MKISVPKRSALLDAIEGPVKQARMDLIMTETPENREAHQQMHERLAAMQDAINNGVTDVLGLECSQ